jgi:hypothetical protein
MYKRDMIVELSQLATHFGRRDALRDCERQPGSRSSYRTFLCNTHPDQTAMKPRLEAVFQGELDHARLHAG